MGTYSTRAIEGEVPPDLAGFSSPRRPVLPFVSTKLLSLQLKRTAIVVGLICLVFTVAAIVSFPEMDDGALAMTINELGSKGIVKAFPDVPLAAWFWRFLLEASGVYFWPTTMVMNGLLWLTFGLEAAYLWVRLFPEHHGYTPLIGCLAIAPIVLQVQTTMLTISSTAVFSSIAGYLSLFLTLICLDRFKLGSLYGFALALLGIAAFFGDYGLSVGFVVFTALFGGAISDHRDMQDRRRRLAWAALATTVVTYGVYRMLVRQNLAVASIGSTKGNLLRQVEGFPLNLFSAAWHVVIGAYGTLLGSFSLTWGSKTLLVSLLFGIFLAFVLKGTLVNETTEALSSASHLQSLFLALVAGLVPLVFDHPFWTQADLPREAESASRYFIPVMPVAACLTFAIVLRVVRSRFRVLVAGLLGLLIGFSLLNQVWTGFRRARVLTNIGSALKTYVVPGDGQVVGVLSTEELCFADFSCTAKASSGWAPESTKNFWLYKPNEALDHLGTRKDCKNVSRLDAGIREVHRSGAISNAVWVQVSGEKFTLEPYCVGDSGTAPVRSSAAPVASPSHPLKGGLSGALAKVTGPQDLTQLGRDDWEHWTSASVPNHKASGGKQISYYSTVGNVSVHDGTNAPIIFKWSDGVPTENSSETKTDIIVGGQGHGFQIAAPADTRERLLSVYVGALKAQGKIQAHLSDSSAPDYFDTSLVSSGDAVGGVYKFTYKAGSPGQLLIVTFTQLTSDPQGSIALEAGALEAKGSGSD